MEKFVAWWKYDRRYVTLLKAVLLALLPLLCCVVYCAGQGQSIRQVYLPASEWNDELFYYKQVEGMIRFGYPQGYFGFDESYALKLSFAAWSPVLVFPWVIWGLVFGWNLMSPILCNIFLMTLCCFLFVWLAKPTWKQLGVLMLLFCLYRPFVRYILSGMPEVICFFMLILFYALSVNYLEREKTWKLVLLLALAGVMTLMRPYFLLFLLLPMFFWVKKSRWLGAVGSAAVMGVVLGLYAWIKHYLGAEYFAPLFFTDWVDAFFDEGVFGGIRYTVGKLYYMGHDFVGHTLEGFRSGLASGTFFGGYLVMLCILLFQSIHDFLERQRNRRAGGNNGKPPEDAKKDDSAISRKLLIEAHLAFSFVAMLFALLLMYKLTEGSKHLLTFMAAGIFVISLMETKFYKKAVLLGVVFAYLYSFKAVSAYDNQVPFLTQERQEKLEKWSKVFAENLELERESAPNFENVVIWVFRDTVDGESRNTAWQILYGLPEGFGISCCMPEYVLENLGTLRSKYLCVTPGGQIDEMFGAAGFRAIHRDEDMVLYVNERDR